MSMIEEKRSEVEGKLKDLLAQRQNSINIALAQYKAKLEAEPLSSEIVKLQELLAALDNVINIEKGMTDVFTQYVDTRNDAIVEAVSQAIPEVKEEVSKAEELVPDISITIDPETKQATLDIPTDVRPGMAYVSVPERR